MSRIVDYGFNELSRIGYDETVFTQDNIMNKNMSNYMTYNPYSNNCLGGLDFAVKQPNVFVNKSTYNVGPLGCNINDSSIITKGELTNNNIKLTLHERPYKTVPYLGKGNVDVYKENKIRLGDTFKEKKSVSKLNEKCFNNLGKYPINSGLKTKLDNSKIESDVHSDWIRGGVDSRNLFKTSDYSDKNNKSLY